MGDLKSRLSSARTRLLRRGSATSAKSPGAQQGICSTLSATTTAATPGSPRNTASEAAWHRQFKQQQQPAVDRPLPAIPPSQQSHLHIVDIVEGANTVPQPPPLVGPATKVPKLTLQEPTPDIATAIASAPDSAEKQLRQSRQERASASAVPVSEPPSPRTLPTTGTKRRQSSVSTTNARAVKTLANPDKRPESSDAPPVDYFSVEPTTSTTSMPTFRKIWVKRPGASATLVTIGENDLVDDVRDMILKKYANSLGRSFDSPDLTLRMVSRNYNNTHKYEDRTLGPEEEICKTLDTYYPGGQKVDEALLIDIPQRRTPKPSPRLPGHAHPLLPQSQAYVHWPGYPGLDADAPGSARPLEHGTDYFPPMPMPLQPISMSLPAQVLAHSPAALSHISLGDARPSQAAHDRSISVLSTGQVPPLPSPGGSRRIHHGARPRVPRQPTSSPTALTAASAANAAAAAAQQQGVGGGVVGPGMGMGVGAGVDAAMPAHPKRQSTRPRLDSVDSASKHPLPGAAVGAPLATPPVAGPGQDAAGSGIAGAHASLVVGGGGVGVVAPAGRSGSPRPAARPKKRRDKKDDKAGAEPDGAGTAGMSNGFYAGLLETAVPPINVLIVEDNMINLKLLEAFMKRLKVRWQTALNGREAVEKWRRGGFHLVLMDIQLPIMSGLEATKEIRRLERVNHIGVFSETPAEVGGVDGTGADGECGMNGEGEGREVGKPGVVKEEDKLGDAGLLFKSPVIIVALTASSLQSDRHEALAAGCNDFLTKPVIFTWLERKVREWGCMQALIDFDGWRKWKDFQNQNGDAAADKKKDGTMKKGDAKRLAAAKKGKDKDKDKEKEKEAPAQVFAVGVGAKEEEKGGGRERDDSNTTGTSTSNGGMVDGDGGGESEA